MSPYTVLFALEQAKAAKRDDATLVLTKPVFISDANTQEGVEMLAQDTNDLIRSVQQNIFEKPSIPNLHLTTIYDNICDDKVEALREWLLVQGTVFHERLRLYLSKFDKDSNPRLYKKDGGVRIAISSFSIVDEKEEKKKHVS